MLTDDRDPLDMLAEEFADRLRRGEHPSVSDYAAAHPEHAADLKELLPAVAQMEMLKRFRAPAATQPLPERLGDFRIVRELGRGGMGVVYEAVQESLGRSVALKVLARHAQLDPMRRERFVREAQAAARLHHTNIVQVFGVGEQDGLPYYVMQLIPGCGLHAVVRKWREQTGKVASATHETLAKHPDTKPAAASGPTTAEGDVSAPDHADWPFVADVGLQAAHALHYAHRQGVLHRDVKPANLILDGETVWVTDFGLAKLMNVDGLTASGDILGTLQYLPPECLHGEADVRSDVYGLGATLYELLTLEPPHQADSPAKLIKQVADADPPHPREINPNIPRDLETIVLKAMSREPSARYPTARELAEDLEAFLDDRPIRARRISVLSWAWRWCRRHKAVASLALSTLVALTLAAVAGWVGYARTTDALGREGDRRKDAEREQRNAVVAKGEADIARRNAESAKADAQQKSEQLEKNLELSLETVGQVFEAAGGSGRPGFGVSMSVMMGGPGPRPGGWFGGPGGPGGPKKDPPPGGPGGEPGGFFVDPAADKAAILEAVLNFYDQFAQQRAPTERVQFEAAKASRRVCEVLAQKAPDKAMVAYNRAVGLLEPLVDKYPEDGAKRTELALTYLAAPPNAFPGDREEPLRRAAELVARDRWLTGAVQFRFGSLREQARDWPGAETAYRAALASFVAVPQANRPTPGHLEPAFARLRIAAALGEQDRLPQARRVLEESVAALRPVADRGDGRGPHIEREWLGITYRALEDVCRRLKDDRAADEAKQNADRYGFGGKKDGGPGGPKKDFGPPKKE
jgi:eukaryotic-like serine/threonine-protein kinase